MITDYKKACLKLDPKFYSDNSCGFAGDVELTILVKNDIIEPELNEYIKIYIFLYLIHNLLIRISYE